MQGILNPATFVEGSLLDDVDVIVKEALFVKFDYDGTVTPPVTALGMVLTEPDGKEHNQYLSAGEGFEPSQDDKTVANPPEGPYIIKTGDKKGINTNTNLAQFLTSLINAGFPADKLESGDIRTLVGLDFHVRRVAIKRGGLVRTGKNANREQTAFTVAKINKMPWEAARPTTSLGASSAVRIGATATTQTSVASATSAPASANGAASALAIETAQGLLIANGGSLPKAKLATLAFSELKGKPEQKEVSQLLMKDEFIKGMEGIKYENGILTMA